MKSGLEGLACELQGRWRVTALGIARPINLLGDEKQIDGHAGHNLINGKRWGWFTVELADQGVVLNYEDDRNGEILQQVRDKMVRHDNGWIGTLFLRGKQIFRFRLDPLDPQQD